MGRIRRGAEEGAPGRLAPPLIDHIAARSGSVAASNAQMLAAMRACKLYCFHPWKGPGSALLAMVVISVC